MQCVAALLRSPLIRKPRIGNERPLRRDRPSNWRTARPRDVFEELDAVPCKGFATKARLQDRHAEPLVAMRPTPCSKRYLPLLLLHWSALSSSGIMDGFVWIWERRASTIHSSTRFCRTRGQAWEPSARQALVDTELAERFRLQRSQARMRLEMWWISHAPGPQWNILASPWSLSSTWKSSNHSQFGGPTCRHP